MSEASGQHHDWVALASGVQISVLWQEDGRPASINLTDGQFSLALSEDQLYDLSRLLRDARASKRAMSAHFAFGRYGDEAIITTREGVTASLGFDTADEVEAFANAIERTRTFLEQSQS